MSVKTPAATSAKKRIGDATDHITSDTVDQQQAGQAISGASGFSAGRRPRAIVPETMDEAMALAKAVVASRMAPRGMETPEACMVAILHGLEVGLTPLMALQRIAVIDGRPTIWGDGAMALVRGSGLCRSVQEWVTGAKPDAWSAKCEVHREGEMKPVRRVFTVADAKQAGLWGGPGPWSTFPRRMLQMRARAFALRDVFADVLGGLYVREELEDPTQATLTERAAAESGPRSYRGPVTAVQTGLPPARRPRNSARQRRSLGSSWVHLQPPRDAIRLRAPAPPGFEMMDEASPYGPRRAAGDTDAFQDGPASAQDTLELLENALSCAQDEESLAEIEQELAERVSALSRESLPEAERIRLRHTRRVQALARGQTA